MASLAGKRVLITGGGSGIGRATAVKLHSLGANLYITDVNGAGAEETWKLCGSDARHWHGVMDVSSSESVKQMLEGVAAGDQEWHLDHVFNNAGINPTVMPLSETPDDYMDKLVSVNLKGMFNVTKATGKYLKAPGGSYVNVSSISGLHGSVGTSIYCATKFGIIGFSKSMALELGPKGIRVNVIAPGYVHTPTNAGVALGTEEAIKKMEQGNALGRMGTPEEMADVVAFLMSDEARYMNGAVVEIDGMLSRK